MKFSLEEYRHAIRTAPLLPGAHYRLAKLLDRLGKEAGAGEIRQLAERRQVESSSWTETARQALLGENPSEALRLARQADPDGHSEQGRYRKARAQLELGQLEGAMQELLLLHEGEPTNAEFAYYLQICAERLSLGALEAFVSVASYSNRTHQLQAEYHATREENNKAIEEYRRALTPKPGASQLHLAIGTLHFRAKNYGEAIAAFQAELKNDPYSVPALARAGKVYFLTGQSDKAKPLLSQAIKLNPAAADALKTLDRLYFKEGAHREAVVHLRLALELGMSGDETIHYHLGRAFYRLGDRDNAQEHLGIYRKVNNHSLQDGGFNGCQLEIDCRRAPARLPVPRCTGRPSRPSSSPVSVRAGRERRLWS